MKTLLLVTVATLGLTSSMMAQNLPNYVPANGLVGWWPFNGNANDESGKGNHGTVNGATLTTDRFGNVGKAYSFDGVDDYIDLSDWSIGGEISISVWVKYNAYNQMSRIINLSNGQYLNPIIFSNDVNTNAGYISADCTPTTVTKNLFSLNSWDFFVLKFTSDSICSIFKNGSLFSSFPMVCNIPNVKRLNQFLGKSDYSVDGYFEGELDDIGIWNRALNQQEITDLYNANICYQNITVTDTLIIKTGITAFNPVTYNNTIKIFPNPTNDHITINYGNYATINGYQLKIENSLGQQLFQTNISKQSDYLDLTNWGGNGIYFVRIIDPQGNTIDIKKIVLQ